MARTTCLADIEPALVPLIRRAIDRSRAPVPAILARLQVAVLGTLAPTLLICDIDSLASDPLEMLRQLRFVLPDCIIVVFTRTVKRAWAVACHSAGANGVLSKAASEMELATGLRASLRSGCFTDPRVEADSDVTTLAVVVPSST